MRSERTALKVKNSSATAALQGRLKSKLFPPKEKMADFESRLQAAETIEEAKSLLQETFAVDEDHLQLLIKLGGLPKLREFYYEVIKFDWLYGTNTSPFIPENEYQEMANNLANPGSAIHGVRHRSSLTSSIREGFTRAVGILKYHGIEPNEATLIALGCGVGKEILIGMSNTEAFYKDDNGKLGYPFKKAIGVDYLQDVLDIADQNIRDSSLKIDFRRPVSLIFQDAAEFRRFNGVNVVYMYNPFDAEIMRKVEKNLRLYAGKTIVIYNKPLCEHIFTKNGWHVYASGQNETDPDRQVAIYSWGLDAVEPRPATPQPALQ